MKIETHYPLAYFYADIFEGECTFELSVDEDNDLIVTICSAIAYRSDLEIELEHLLTEYDLQLIATEIYHDLLNSDLHEEFIQEEYNTKLQNAYENGKNSRRSIDLPDQVRWWLTGEGWVHKNGHFNFNHYCNVVHAKYEEIRNNTLLSRNANGTKETNKIRCRSVFPTPR